MARNSLEDEDCLQHQSMRTPGFNVSIWRCYIFHPRNGWFSMTSLWGLTPDEGLTPCGRSGHARCRWATATMVKARWAWWLWAHLGEMSFGDGKNLIKRYRFCSSPETSTFLVKNMVKITFLLVQNRHGTPQNYSMRFFVLSIVIFLGMGLYNIYHPFIRSESGGFRCSPGFVGTPQLRCQAARFECLQKSEMGQGWCVFLVERTLGLSGPRVPSGNQTRLAGKSTMLNGGFDIGKSLINGPWNVIRQPVDLEYVGISTHESTIFSNPSNQIYSNIW